MKHERIILWLIIIANSVIFSYAMLYYPCRCGEAMVLSGGVVTCGTNAWGYLTGIACCLVATMAALLLISEQ
jgi:hypothetical protein